MTRFFVRGRQIPRRLALVLGAAVAAATVMTVAPVRAQEGGRDCSPGYNCTGFGRDAYGVTEGTAHLDLAVYAAWCCPAGQGQIDYETVDGSAVAGEDYQRTSGTLTYAGHGGASIRVPISADGLSEGTEQFEVRLTNFRGTFVNRGYETAVVTIVDPFPDGLAAWSASLDDSSQGTPGALENASAPQTAVSAASPASGTQEGVPAPSVPQARPKDTESATSPLPGAKKAGERGPPSGLFAVLGCLLLVTAFLGTLPVMRARRT